MRKVFWLALALTSGTALLTILLVIPSAGLVQSTGDRVSTGAAPPTAPLAGAGLLNIDGSNITTENCYEDDQAQTLCFTVYNGSADAEWLDEVRLTFPNVGGLGPWNVACKSQDANDSSGYPVNLSCTPSGNEVRYIDNDVEVPTNIGEVTSGSSWGFCVDVTIPSGYDGPRIINWGLSGDEAHDITGETTIEACTPLMLKPDSLEVEGCNGVVQAHVFELWNNTGSGGTFDLSYIVPANNATFSGPDDLTLSTDEIITFTVQLTPNLCLEPGDKLTVTLSVEGNGQFDASDIVHTTTPLSGWGTRASSPAPSMDNVVVWASQTDGGLWSIGGYGAEGATQRYDPETGTWSTHTPETVITPTIEYPMDGCYGLNGDGDEVVVLFPDTIVTGSLHIYNISDDAWYNEAIPAFYPPEGRWGQDIVSLLNTPGVNQNTCYLSGGSPQTGGGRTRDLWVYYPETNSGAYLGVFYSDTFPINHWFNFHASWYVPWVGNAGSICVGGGIDHNSQIVDATQCYDLDTNSFRAPNADLGPLPERWWGMADGWQVYDGRYQIWLANGVAQDGTLLPASAFADQTTGGFQSGPGLPVGLYRLEGEGVDGQFYVEQGSAGGFAYSDHNILLVRCPECQRIYLPVVLRAAP